MVSEILWFCLAWSFLPWLALPLSWVKAFDWLTASPFSVPTWEEPSQRLRLANARLEIKHNLTKTLLDSIHCTQLSSRYMSTSSWTIIYIFRHTMILTVVDNTYVESTLLISRILYIRLATLFSCFGHSFSYREFCFKSNHVFNCVIHNVSVAKVNSEHVVCNNKQYLSHYVFSTCTFTSMATYIRMMHNKIHINIIQCMI